MGEEFSLTNRPATVYTSRIAYYNNRAALKRGSVVPSMGREYAYFYPTERI